MCWCVGECVFPEALCDLWQCVDPAPSEHINEAATNFVFTAFSATSEHINEAGMNFVFTAFCATIFISGMLCVSRAARRLRVLADQRAARRLRALAELEPQPARVEAELRRHGVEESADAPPMAEAPSGTFATGSESKHQGVQTSSSSSHSQARPTPSMVHSWKPGDWQ